MDLDIQKADVEGAHLNGTLGIDIYMRCPEGVGQSAGCDALKLNKAPYGLKRSGRLWWQELGSKLEGLGFSKLHSDWGLYVRAGTDDRDFMMLLVYVDDFIIAAKTEEISGFLREVQTYWKLSGMGELDNVLGMKVVRDRSARKIHLTRPAYINKIAKQFPTTHNLPFDVLLQYQTEIMTSTITEWRNRFRFRAWWGASNGWRLARDPTCPTPPYTSPDI